MAGKGFAPSGKRSRESDQRRDEAAVTYVEADGDLRGPDLPELGPDGEGNDRHWPAMTRRWWLTWRKSPQATTFTDTDWDFLAETALIHRLFVLGDVKQAAELRLRVAKFGATPEDRARLRLGVGKPGPSTPRQAPPAPSGQSRRDRVLSVVADAG